MFHNIKEVFPLKDFRLNVHFFDVCTKSYDLNPLINSIPEFKTLKDNPAKFYDVSVDVGGYGIIWDDDLDLSCDELWEHGYQIKAPFDNLIAFSDATSIWHLNESTLRKAITYGKLKNGIDACKFGKQWVVSIDAMKRVYGDPS